MTQEVQPQPIPQSSMTTWVLLTLISLAANAGWVFYLLNAPSRPDPLVFIGIGNCLLACFTGSLMGLFAARKRRRALPWSLGFGLPAIVAGFFPLIAGALVMAFLPVASSEGTK